MFSWNIERTKDEGSSIVWKGNIFEYPFIMTIDKNSKIVNTSFNLKNNSRLVVVSKIARKFALDKASIKDPDIISDDLFVTDDGMEIVPLSPKRCVLCRFFPWGNVRFSIYVDPCYEHDDLKHEAPAVFYESSFLFSNPLKHFGNIVKANMTTEKPIILGSTEVGVFNVRENGIERFEFKKEHVIKFHNGMITHRARRFAETDFLLEYLSEEDPSYILFAMK